MITEPALLLDEAARSSIANDLGETLFVEAGAGSGKTTALVARIVSLVARGGAQLSGIAAITFTEAAAAELRLKVREALEEAAGSSDLSEAERHRCAEALSRIDEAPISTIHGFCRRILAAHPIEAGLPPRFELLHEVAEGIEWRRRWSSELDRLSEDEAAADLISAAWTLEIDDRRIELLARALDVEWHRWDPPPPDLAAVLARVVAQVGEGSAELQARLRTARVEMSRCSDPEDRLFRKLEALGSLSHSLASAADWHETLSIIAADTVLSSRSLGTDLVWGGWVDSVRDLVAKAAELRRSLLQSLLDLLLETLAAYLQARSRVAAGERRRRGLLGFHDLLVFCRDLLEENPRVALSVRRRFSHVLIDEFQDTDGLQLEIARLIGAERGSWEPGRCFFVGDPKQSIYRFRGADLAAYEAARGEIVGSGATLLSSNFRSVPGIIDFVNASFDSLLAERFHPLAAVRPPAAGGGAESETAGVYLVGGAFPDRTRRTEQRRIESEECCAAIELALFEERWTVEDEMTGERRPARLGDVAILVPRRTGLSELEEALDAHSLGYRVESASLIFKSQEVRDLLHLARALDEPGDQAALVATLRSPAYSIGDDELVAWAAGGGEWSAEAPPSPSGMAAAPRVGEALGDLARLRLQMEELGPVGTLSLALRERRLLQLAAGGPRARESWRRLRFLLDKARVFVESGGGGLGALADWIDEQAEGGLRSAESVVPDADEDVVRILTVHGAKGLEFPITVLCGFGTSDEASGRPETILRHPDGSVEVHLHNLVESSGYKALRTAARLLESEEAVRLGYVAATRARDHLVICAHHLKSSTRPTLGERLLDAVAETGLSLRQLTVVPEEATGSPRPAEGRPVESSNKAPLAAVSTVASYEEWLEGRRALVASASMQASVRATELATLAGLAGWPDEGATLEAEEEEGDLPASSPARRPGRAGTRIGRAVHATLQAIPLADAVALGGPSEDERARRRLFEAALAQARAERVDDRGEEVAHLALAALGSPVVQRAFASGSARRESYVAAPCNGVVLDGYVDLSFTEDDGSLTVVDYKTDSVRSPEEAARRAAGYELQAAGYALALGEATGLVVSRCVLVFLSPPARPIEHELKGEELAARIATVRQLLGELS